MEVFLAYYHIIISCFLFLATLGIDPKGPQNKGLKQVCLSACVLDIFLIWHILASFLFQFVFDLRHLKLILSSSIICLYQSIRLYVNMSNNIYEMLKQFSLDLIFLVR